MSKVLSRDEYSMFYTVVGELVDPKPEACFL